MELKAALAALTLVLVAGCSAKTSGGTPDSASDFSGLGAAASATTGVILGVVVDEAIRPIDGATVTIHLLSGGDSSKVSDSQGRFVFSGLEPGTYLLKVSRLLYAASQTSVQVEAGVAEPPVTRVLLTRLFTQEAYSEATKFDGFIQCGYSNPQIETQCVDDYTRFVVPGGLAPQLKSLADHRFYLSAVGAGWQTMVFELVWEPTAQGTSQEMFLTSSYYNRTGTDWWFDVTGPSPLLGRLEVGEVHPTHSGSPDKVPKEGLPDLYTFAGIHGDVVAVGFSQSFTLIQHNFYYGKPPEGWSFVAGDAPPF